MGKGRFQCFATFGTPKTQEGKNQNCQMETCQQWKKRSIFPGSAILILVRGSVLKACYLFSVSHLYYTVLSVSHSILVPLLSLPSQLPLLPISPITQSPLPLPHLRNTIPCLRDNAVLCYTTFFHYSTLEV